MNFFENVPKFSQNGSVQAEHSRPVRRRQEKMEIIHHQLAIAPSYNAQPAVSTGNNLNILWLFIVSYHDIVFLCFVSNKRFGFDKRTKENNLMVQNRRKTKHPHSNSTDMAVVETKLMARQSDHDMPLSRWKFRCMLTNRGICAIKPWLMRLSVRARANLDRTVEHLSLQPSQKWSRPDASPIGNHIYVIRFRDENGVQHRIFGHFSCKGTPDASFVMTLEGYEKGDVYYPVEYKKTASERRNQCVDSHANRTILCRYAQLDHDDAPGDASGKFHTECATCVC